MNAFHLLCTRTLSVLLSCSVAASTSFAAPPEVDPQSTQDIAKARVHFERGVELYDSGDVRAASIAFKRAYELVPNYQLLFNIAQTQAELKDYVGALASLTQYLQDGGDEVSADRRSEVQTEMERLETYIAHLQLKVSVKGAELWIDGERVEMPKKGEKVAVSIGRRKIELRHSDYQTWEKRIEVVGEEQVTLEIEMLPRATRVSAPIEATPPQEKRIEPVPLGSSAPKKRLGGYFWSGVTATAVFGTGSIILGALALRAKGDHDQARKRVPTTLDTLDRSARKVKALGLATDIGLILTVGAAAFTVSTLFWGPNKRTQAKEQRLNAAISPGGVWLQGRF